MNSHYVLSINPQAIHHWDQYVIRNPITGERPDLNLAIAEAVNHQPGSYLIRVNIDVQVLETSNNSKIREKNHTVIENDTEKLVSSIF